MKGKIFACPRGTFGIDYRDGSGKRHRERIGSRKAAKAALRARLREVARGTWRPAHLRSQATCGLTFREVALEALEHRTKTGAQLKSRSVETDLGRLGAVFTRIGAIPIASITREILKNLFLDLARNGANPSAPQPLSGGTLNRYRSVVNSAFKHALDIELIDVNPMVAVKHSKERPYRDRYLSADEENRIRAEIRKTCPDREAEFDLSLASGMRRGEQFTARYDAIDFVSKQLSVAGKTGPRRVFLNDAAMAAIEKLRQHAERDGRKFVFLSPDTTHEEQRHWPNWFAPIVKAAGVVRYSWHTNRHTYASRLAMAGTPLLDLAKLLGHTKTTMTERYSHLSPSYLSRSLGQAESLQPTP
jgi:site-specific recombinase XerD